MATERLIEFQEEMLQQKGHQLWKRCPLFIVVEALGITTV